MPPKRDLKQVDSEPEDVEDAIEVREDTEKQRKISEELNEKQIGIFQGVFPSVKGGQLEGQALNGLYSGESNHPVTLHTLNLKHSKYTDGYFTNIETVKE